jgi:hypothetical protein
MINCTLRNNSAVSGGAIDTTNFEPSIGVSLEKCTLANNRVSYRGGAIESGRGEVALTNCTLSENRASSITGPNQKPGGGAIFNRDGTVIVTNCTFDFNRADGDAHGSSIYNEGAGTITTANTIYDRMPTSDWHFVNEGTFISRGHNMCNDGGSGLLNAAGDKSSHSAGLQPLAYNGGATQTCAIGQDSLAMNAGDDAIAPPTDQRGFARSGVSDIGAYERTP